MAQSDTEVSPQRPPHIHDDADEHRWDLCRVVAERMYPGDEALIWQTTRSLYDSDIPTELAVDAVTELQDSVGGAATVPPDGSGRAQ